MSWFRVEGRMPQHRKVAPLSDAAFRLFVTAGAWCADEPSPGGLVPKLVVPTLTRAPRGRRLVDALKELVDAGLWKDEGEAYRIHDFEKWNPGIRGGGGSEPAAPRSAPTAAPAPTAPASRSEAARQAGIRSAEVRRERFGSAAPNKAPNERRTTSERRSVERTPNDLPNDSERTPNGVRSNDSRTNAEPARARSGSDPDPVLLSTPPKDLTGYAPNEASNEPNEAFGGGGDFFENRLALDYVSECPPRLVDLCSQNGLTATLAREYRASIADVELAIRTYGEFFWQGRGHGEKRRHWGRQVRGRILDLSRANRLVGIAQHADGEQQQASEAPLSPEAKARREKRLAAIEEQKKQRHAELAAEFEASGKKLPGRDVDALVTGIGGTDG
jgi:hypothetical protein